MICYGDFLRALDAWTARTGWKILNASDVYKAAESAGFTRAQILQFYAIYRTDTRRGVRV